MNDNDYLKIIYTGISENHINKTSYRGYFKRVQKKAEADFVEADEFFERLSNAIELIEKSVFQIKYHERLNQHYMNMNREAAAPEGQKFGYPTNKPKLEDINVPMIHLTIGAIRTPTHLYIHHIWDFKIAMDEVKSEIEAASNQPKKAEGLRDRLDFTQERLRPIILELAKLTNLDSPIPTLDKLLNEVISHDDAELEMNFFIHVHHLCQEYATEFWSEKHRKEITNWFSKARFIATKIITDGIDEIGLPKLVEVPLLSTTWNSSISNNAKPQPVLWETLIKVELLENRLPEIEKKIEKKIENWKIRKDLIECAAYCQLLFDLNYFNTGATSRKTPASYALSKFSADIKVQLESTCKTDRDKHKNLLKKYFK